MRERESVTQVEGEVKFGKDNLATKDSVDILGVEVDSKLSFCRHLETVAYKTSLTVTLPGKVRHLDPDGFLTFYKAQVRSVMEYIYSPLTWMLSCIRHLLLRQKERRTPHRHRQATAPE